MTKHFGTGKHAGVDAPAWLPVGRQVGTLVNDWANRGDLIVRIGPNESAPAPALFNPAVAEVEVNTDQAFGPAIDPASVGDLNERSVQFEWPKATGAILHEALHARYTTWSLEEAAKLLTDSQNAALHLLEESRIEGLGVKVMPRNRGFLRSCALEIVLGDLDADSLAAQGTTRAAAHIAGLTLARVDAGVLQRSDVETVADHIETVLGEELLSQLREIWTQFQTTDVYSGSDKLRPLAIAWDRLVSEEAEKRGEPEPGGDVPESVKRFIEDLIEKLGDDAAGTVISASDELGDQEQTEDWEEQAQARSKAGQRRGENKSVATKIFDKSTGPDDTGASRSQLLNTRSPLATERAAAVQIAKLLEKAKYRERGQTEVKSVTPPGRLRTGAMVQGAALKSKGVRAQVEPWRRTVRKHTENPELRVGVMVDISGSMGSAMDPMATTAWVLSEAVRRVQGKAAMVYYGSDVFATLKPGQHLREVRTYTAPDGTEKFDKAFKALDGSMSLLDGSGARLLVVVSDGEYTPEEAVAAKKWVRACEASGVAVLWVSFGATRRPTIYLDGTSGQVVNVSGANVTAAAKLIGDAAAKALTRVGARR